MATYNAYSNLTLDQRRAMGGGMNDQDLGAYMRQYQGDPAKMLNFLKAQNLDPAAAARVLEATGGSAADVENYVKANPSLQDWFSGKPSAPPTSPGAGGPPPAAQGGALASVQQTGLQPQYQQPPTPPGAGGPPPAASQSGRPDFGAPPDNSGRWALTNSGWQPAANVNAMNAQGSTIAPNGAPIGWGGRSSLPGGGQGAPNPYMPNSSPTQTPGNAPQAPGNGMMSWQGPNPYTQQIGADITRQVTNNLQRNILPSIGRGAVAAGGYGGSRQGVAEGLAVGETNQALAGQLANLYGGQFNADRNYGLQSDALDLNVYNANQNWMNQGQQNQLQFIDKMLGWNQQGTNAATTIQNTPLNYYSQFANIGQGLGGMGQSQSQNMSGNPLLGAIAGYQLGSKIGG